MKNLIMGYATNSKFDDFYRFVVSIRQHCHPNEVDVAVFINDLGSEFSELALENNITLIPIENVWKWVVNSKILNLIYYAKMLGLQALRSISSGADRIFLENDYRNTIAAWIHPQAGRWIAYYTFLKVNSSYRIIMTSDVRDVVFQASPFDGLDGNMLYVFEQAALDYGQQGDENVDTEWFHAVYGKKALTSMAGKPTLCSGTVLGGHLPMLQLLELMTSEVQRHPRRPFDQAIFNHVIYDQFPHSKLIKHPLKSGPVLTLCGDHEGCWEIHDAKVMVDGRIVPVVHMYDRNVCTKELFLGKITISHE
jgi:hypothetical protein